jgi:hypothetical protein
MKTLILSSLVLLGLSGAAAFAQTPTTFADVDADSSGELGFAELQTAWPDLAQAEFDKSDADASGGLSVSELNIMQAVMNGTPQASAPAPAPEAPKT